MKRIKLQQGIILALFLMLTACSSSKYDAIIVGVWHGEPSNSYKMRLVTGHPDTTMKQIPPQTEQEMRQFNREFSRLKQQGATAEEIAAPFIQAIAVYQETYVLKSHGKGGWTTPGGESGYGTWKLQQGGKQLVLNDPAKNTRVKLHVDSLSRTKMVVTFPDLPVEVRLIYTKE